MNIRFDVLGEDEVEQFLATKAERIVDAIRAQMQVAELELLGYIKDEKLSGQVLHQRSGNLKNSGFTETEESGGQITGYVGFGRTVPYAAILNYGGDINIPEVTGKLMVFERGGNTVFTMRHRAFTVNMPARNYMESSVDETQESIQAGFERVIAEATSA